MKIFVKRHWFRFFFKCIFCSRNHFHILHYFSYMATRSPDSVADMINILLQSFVPEAQKSSTAKKNNTGQILLLLFKLGIQNRVTQTFEDITLGCGKWCSTFLQGCQDLLTDGRQNLRHKSLVFSFNLSLFCRILS